MNKVALDIETIKELREALVASQQALRGAPAQEKAAIEKAAGDKAKVAVLAKKAAEVLSQRGFLKPELAEAWTARASSTDGCAIALEALEKVASTVVNEEGPKRLGRGRKAQEKQASAEVTREQIEKKFTSKLGFA